MMELDPCTEGSVAAGNGDSDAEDNALDPRIQRELDQLNLASTEINRLENELDEARGQYRSTVSEISNQMESVARDRKKSIHKAREYYKLTGEARIAQGEALKAVRQFQTATSVYKAAKETMTLAECRLTENNDTNTTQLTSAWQEMLNHATTKVMEAEKDKTKRESEHRRRANKFAQLEQRIQAIEKKHPRSIKKARPYFELKAELDIKLIQQKQNVNDLLTAIKATKKKYNGSLRELERISEEIHQSRNEKIWSKIPRMPGVGAETDSVCSSLSELAIDPAELSICGSASSLYGEDDDSFVSEDAEVDDPIGDRNSLPESSRDKAIVNECSEIFESSAARSSDFKQCSNSDIENEETLDDIVDTNASIKGNEDHNEAITHSHLDFKQSESIEKPNNVSANERIDANGNGAAIGKANSGGSYNQQHCTLDDAAEEQNIEAGDAFNSSKNYADTHCDTNIINGATDVPVLAGRKHTLDQYEDEDMVKVDMASVERPSLSGEEES